MGKFDGILLASDFDDTLYDLTHHLPERNLEAIRYFIGEGGYFCVSTGRAHRTFAPFAPLVPMNAPAVLSNGAAIYDFRAGRMLEQTCLPDTAPADLARLMEEFPSLSLEVYHGETEPLKGFYEGKGILIPVANQSTIEGTNKVIMEALGL